MAPEKFWKNRFFFFLLLYVMGERGSISTREIMQNISELLDKYITNNKILIPEYKSERASLIKEIYSYYELQWKKDTFHNYLKWAREHKYPNTIEFREDFKNTKNYFPKKEMKEFCSRYMCFIKENRDLNYVISIAKDMQNRKQNFNKWLFWALKPQ